MKKILLFSTIIAIALSSCKKDPKSEKDDMDDLFKLEYSNLTTEQNKKTVENAGIEFVKKINSLPDEEFIDVLKYLTDLGPEITSSSTVSSVFAIGNAAERKDIKGIFKATTSAVDQSAKLSELYKIYTWNASTEMWDETASSDKLEFRFPSAANKNTNNAVLTLSYVASKVKATIDAESVELPSSITAVLKVNNNEALKLTSAYEYKSDGTPTNVDINLLMGAFTLKTKVSNTTSKLSSEFSIRKGTEVLISLNAAATGSLSVDNANKADDVSDVIQNANASFEIMNIKLAGQIDFKSLSKETKAFENKSDSISNVKETALWNKYLNLAVINKNDNTIIAKVEFMPVSDRDCYSWWNGSTMVNECHTYYDMSPKFVFKDGSSISDDNFDDSDFAQLISDLEDFAEKFD